MKTAYLFVMILFSVAHAAAAPAPLYALQCRVDERGCRARGFEDLNISEVGTRLIDVYAQPSKCGVNDGEQDGQPAAYQTFRSLTPLAETTHLNIQDPFISPDAVLARGLENTVASVKISRLSPYKNLYRVTVDYLEKARTEGMTHSRYLCRKYRKD